MFQTTQVTENGKRIMNPDTFKPLLAKLISSPKSFTRSDAVLAMEHLLEPASTMPGQVGSFLTALHMSGMESHSDILAGGAEVLRKHSVAIPPEARSGNSRVVDIVGTGGDGHNTFNVSTTAAIVAAGAGAQVLKHGNKASTSSSGSADLLMALGCPLSPPTSSATYPTFRFFLAPHYHPLLAPLAPIRRSLPHRTLFNLLGPLVNPARPEGIVLGVAHSSLGETFVQALSKDETIKHAMVVCGEEHLDEISCAGRTRVWEYKRGEPGETSSFKESIISSETFGLDAHPLSSVAGGKGPEENAEIFKQLLMARDEDALQDLKPVLEFVLMNAAAVLVVAGVASDLKDGVRRARESILNGSAWNAFKGFRDWDRGIGGLEEM